MEEEMMRIASDRECGQTSGVTNPVLIVVLLCATVIVEAGDEYPESTSSHQSIPSGADDNWHQWRGPTSNGAASALAHPPVHWDSKVNMDWATDLVGIGSATPIVWEDQIFVLSAEETDLPSPTPVEKRADAKTEPPDRLHRFLVTSIDRHTGRIVWQKVAAEEVPHEGRHPTHTYAAASPTTDGRRLYASFGSRGIYAYSLDGELLWQNHPGKMKTRFSWGECVTPALAGDLLIVNWDQEENSFIMALDVETGTERWRKPRSDEVTSWNTPLITSFDGTLVAIVNGSGRARAYRVEDGEVLWECGGQTVNAIPSPIRYEDFVVVMSGYQGAAAFAIPLSSRGLLNSESDWRWTHHARTPYVPSPTASGDRLYFTAANSDVLTVLNLKTGVSTTSLRLGIGNVYASPLAAAGRIYIIGRQGTCVVLSDAPHPEQLAVNSLDGTFDASPVAVGSQLLLRSWTRLYSLQSPSSP